MPRRPGEGEPGPEKTGVACSLVTQQPTESHAAGGRHVDADVITVEDRVRTRILRSKSVTATRGWGVRYFRHQEGFSQSRADDRTAFDLSVSPQVLGINGSSSWHDKHLLETASYNGASSMHCRQSSWGRWGTAGGKAGEAGRKGPKCLVWIGRPAGEKKPLRLPGRAEHRGLYVCTGVQFKAETKAPSHAGRSRYVHVR